MTEDLSKAAPAPATTLPVRYFRAGGFNQLHLETAEDLKVLATLDQTLWVASSCPTTGLNLDEKTLNLMDTDGDGRIRVPEILAAVNWALDVLNDPSGLPEGRDWIALEQINTGSETGARLHEAVRRILRNLDRYEDTKISLADALDRKGIFAVAKSNGDGVIPVAAADGPTVAQVIQDILNTIGGAADRSGETGITAAGVDAFYSALQAYADWWAAAHPAARNLLIPEDQAQPDLPELDPVVFPLGDQTAAASAAIEAVAVKVEEFFESCEVAAFDAQAVSFLNFSERDLGQLGGRTKAEIDAMLQTLPLARVQPDSPLPLAEGVNPYYASALAALNQAAVVPLLGEEKLALTRAQWNQLRAAFAPYRAWIAAKAGAEVEKLGLPRMVELLRESQRSALEVLIKMDEAIATEIVAVDEVEKLLRYHRDLFRLLNNYVAMPEFFDMESRAVFQMGKLIIDGCALSLCVDVEDMAKHALIAEKSGIFLAYCELSRKDRPVKKTICAAVTYRSVGRITVGKNAVFYDRYGVDWDARVVKVVANPISLREAAVAPFKKIGDLISTQMDKLASSREKAIEANVSQGFTNVDKSLASAGTDKTAPAKPAAGGGMGVGGMLAGGGVALAALTSSFAYIAQTFQKVNNLQLLYTALIVILCIMLPSVLVGYLKLRSRDIGMVLEACGWAINGRMRINLRLARQLMHVGRFSKLSQRTYPDYAQKRGGIWRWVLWLWLLGFAATAATYLYRAYWMKAPPEPVPAVQAVEAATEAAAPAEAGK